MRKTPAYTTGQKALSRKEAEAVILSADSFEDKILVMIGFSLGLRREDLVRIELQNIQNGELSYLEKKKGNRIKTVPLSDRLIQELKLYKEAHTVPGQKYLFPALQKTHHCDHMSSKTAYNRFNALCKKVGIKTPIPVHAMRATCIKLHQEEGWSIAQVASLIGDKVSTVQEHYDTPNNSEIAKMMKERSSI
jgi:integrase